ncbi:membrane dipeptidase [Chryseobacterium arthrosphaerae]|uniref:membrane dipeptidase n=1 Tax=Chryseobacterium arthrosphaerae TaxID=651561 RepID=UPI001F4BA347|nr:membrane dipeptidase [Chryseobacterium arthrosphaerae]MDG4652985.1 membrane dipeptidase [Chryseobacterium arthrosphaerae]
MKNIFDFHFHLLFKHLISKKDTGRLPLNSNFKTKGLMSVIDEFMGNAFDSQSSPAMVKNSSLGYGVTALMAMEYAFAENINGFFKGFSPSKLPISWDFIDRVKNRETTYFDLLKEEIAYYQSNYAVLENDFKIKFISRKRPPAEDIFSNQQYTYLAFSVEGAHNFSDAKIRDTAAATDPEKCYREIQDDPDNVDLFSINLVHLSEIPEQHMCGFAQALNGTAQIAFRSEDFIPKSGFGISDKGKDFIRTVFLHSHPSLIDIKHMSVFSRHKFYQFREELGAEHPETLRLPIISSHTGFTFSSIKDFLEQKNYRSTFRYVQGKTICEIQAKNQVIGKTDFLLNNKLFGNPWTINLFDEEILEIMKSNGLIGISMDQRILGAAKSMMDGSRPEYFKDPEAIPLYEWRKWFKEGTFDLKEAFITEDKTDREIRHIYLLCAHILYAVRLGYSEMNWVGERSPWDHICIGSDYDGLINPINPYDDVTTLGKLRNDLLVYLPIVDKRLEPLKDIRAFKNKNSEPIEENYLVQCVDKFLSENGKNFLKRYLNNWK